MLWKICGEAAEDKAELRWMVNNRVEGEPAQLVDQSRWQIRNRR